MYIETQNAAYCRGAIYCHTNTISPPDEQHIWMSENDFGFGGDHLKPLIEVSTIKDKRGKDL